jgi:hypothetical protein
MTELRSKMIKSMELRNLSKNTQRSYLGLYPSLSNSNQVAEPLYHGV